MKSIWGNTIVKNEGRYIWFALMSVVDYLDKILVWDSGSCDKTVEIIKEVQKKKKNKIEFKEIGDVDEHSFSIARQKMLEESNCNWLFILDGDEVWWDKSIRIIVETIQKKGDDLDLIVTPFYSVVGDIYHYQEEVAGQYNLAGYKGHLNIRAINRKIPGLHVDKPYGQEGYFDEKGKKIQDGNPKRILFLDEPYMHFSNISRSSLKSGDDMVMQRSGKKRHEIGIQFPKDFKYPEVFNEETPQYVPPPWKPMTPGFRFRSALETPLRKLKRRLM